MRIVTLIENSPGPEGCACEHGLSFYIETKRHKILSDTGQTAALLDNADRLGVDLSAVDAVFLSHGHYDHGGGILPFVTRNPNALIYMRRTALRPYYALDPDGPRYIGVSPEIAALPQVRLLDGDTVLDGELTVLGDITGRRRWPAGNLELKRKDRETLVQDSFDHEQLLIVTQGDNRYLFSGCAHNGILNVLDRFRAVYGKDPDAVFSGFHFMKGGAYTAAEEENIRATARELAGMETVFYSGHCTGHRAFAILREIMGERLKPLHSGLEIDIPD